MSKFKVEYDYVTIPALRIVENDGSESIDQGWITLMKDYGPATVASELMRIKQEFWKTVNLPTASEEVEESTPGKAAEKKQSVPLAQLSAKVAEINSVNWIQESYGGWIPIKNGHLIHGIAATSSGAWLETHDTGLEDKTTGDDIKVRYHMGVTCNAQKISD